MAPSFLGKLGPSGKHGLSSESGPDGISWGTCPILPAAGEHWPYSACSARSRCTAGEAQHTWNGGACGFGATWWPPKATSSRSSAESPCCPASPFQTQDLGKCWLLLLLPGQGPGLP